METQEYATTFIFFEIETDLATGEEVWQYDAVFDSTFRTCQGLRNLHGPLLFFVAVVL